MTAPGRWIGAAAVAWAIFACGSPAAAQGTPALERVDSLVRVGQTERAREALQAWWPDAEKGSRTDLQRGIWLRARLTVDPAQAITDYQRLVVEYPGGPFSDAALLRLAQAAHARGELLEAATRYRSLLVDYPGSPARLEARTWLDAHGPEVEAAREDAARAERARAASDQGERRAAEERERQAAEERERQAADDRRQEAAADSGAAEGAERPGASAEAAGSGSRPDAPGATRGAYTVQLGAFSTEARARILLARVVEAGLEGRLVRVPGSGLIRVRVGRFEDSAAANRLYGEVRAGGFDAVVTRDAAREVPVR